VSRPLLLVDFDGVINVVGRTEKGLKLEAAFKREGYRIRVPVGMAERFTRLEAKFDCVWATTWGQDAQVLGRFIGFGADWPVIFIGSGTRLSSTGKLPEVRRWCESNAMERPIAWVDDDLWPDAHDWAISRGQTLIVRTLPEEGLTDAQAEQILGWVATEERSSDWLGDWARTMTLPEKVPLSAVKRTRLIGDRSLGAEAGPRRARRWLVSSARQRAVIGFAPPPRRTIESP
jgi:HAD domain in Swiss Army Knife RNA repair proteins